MIDINLSLLNQKYEITNFIIDNIMNKAENDETEPIQWDDETGGFIFIDRELSLFNDLYRIIKINSDPALGQVCWEWIPTIDDDYDINNVEDIKELLLEQSITYLSMFKKFLEKGGTSNSTAYELINNSDLSYDNRKELVTEYLA